MVLVSLKKNAGYPGGMNKGLEVATGEFIFLISSDVLVPPGTFNRLAAAMREHPAAGLIGPVSNTAGNEQQIFMRSELSRRDVLREGSLFADAGGVDASCFTAYRLDFCCVCLRRVSYECIGGFDEAYAPGYYEDFDYSLLTREAGFEVLIAENAFVFHEGGATFGRDSKAKKQLMKRNKAYLLSKHGRTTRMPHVRDANLSVLAQYAERAGRDNAPPLARIENRLMFARHDQPRSFFKRLRYRRRLAKIEQKLAPFLADAAKHSTSPDA